MIQPTYVISKYHEMSSETGSEKLVDIGTSSRIRLFSVFSIYSFLSVANLEMGFSLTEGDGGSDIYSSGMQLGSLGANTVNITPFAQYALPDQGVMFLSDMYVQGNGNGLKALTIFYQVG
jgi:hypothetical protein